MNERINPEFIESMNKVRETLELKNMSIEQLEALIETLCIKLTNAQEELDKR